MFDQLGFGEGVSACFVDKRRGRAKRRQRRHQLQQLEIEAFAGRDAPAHVIASPHARHLGPVRSGRNEAGKNSSFGMTVRERRHDGQDPVHPWRRPRPSAEKMPPYPHAAAGMLGSRLGEEATADRPCHARLSTTTAANLPCERRDGEPRNRREDEGQAEDCTIISQITRPKAASSKLPSAALTASSAAVFRLTRAGLPADPLSLCVPGHAFRSELRLQGKIAGKSEKQAAKDWSEAGRDEACDHGHRPAEDAMRLELFHIVVRSDERSSQYEH